MQCCSADLGKEAVKSEEDAAEEEEDAAEEEGDAAEDEEKMPPVVGMNPGQNFN